MRMVAGLWRTSATEVETMEGFLCEVQPGFVIFVSRISAATPVGPCLCNSGRAGCLAFRPLDDTEVGTPVTATWIY